MEITRAPGLLERHRAGRLEQALTLYDRAGDNAALNQEILDLREELARLRGQLSSENSARKLANAIDTVQTFAGEVVRSLGEYLIFCVFEPYFAKEREYGDQERDFRRAAEG